MPTSKPTTNIPDQPPLAPTTFMKSPLHSGLMAPLHAPTRRPVQKGPDKRMVVGELFAPKADDTQPLHISPPPSEDKAMAACVQKSVAEAIAKIALPTPLP